MHDESAPPSPVATYRLQLNSALTFDDAQRRLPYLRRLGISHLYLSPIWQATAGSTHGYDVLDHQRISEDLGGLSGFVELAEAAHDLGLRVVADIVPNHVAVGSVEHRWWRDVLRFGERSSYAPYFDIDWWGRGGVEPGLLVLPVLNGPVSDALTTGSLRLDYSADEFVVCCSGKTFPVRPGSYTDVLGPVPEAASSVDLPAFARVHRVIEGLAQAHPNKAIPLLAEFVAVVRESSAVAGWVASRCDSLNGTPGEPDSARGLERILAAQHYRLCDRRSAAAQINYRRFFDLNELAAIRMEHQPAFDDTHRLVFELVDRGLIDGLRVDHVDGLRDPKAYLEAVARRLPGTPIWVEKILAADETLPGWPVRGTTGYDFAAAVEGLFYDEPGRRQLLAANPEVTGVADDFATVAFEARRSVAEVAFEADVDALARDFHHLASAEHRDIAFDQVRAALIALLACYPQYRTYSDSKGSTPHDRAVVHRATVAVQSRDATVNAEAMAFIEAVFVGTGSPDGEPLKARRRILAQRFQQLSPAIMAKGIEDTAFFRYTPLLGQNEVGMSPERAPLATDFLHRWFQARTAQPATMNATSTHDSKRSEDARMRLAVLSELPDEWLAQLRSWTRLNTQAKERAGGGMLPDRLTESYLYQSLVAIWDGAGGSAFIERISDHMRKASREAKTWTSWAEPNDECERRLVEFVHAILEPTTGTAFRAELDAFVRRIEPAARSNSLALLTLKCVAPGLPDFYQGAEDWLFTVTDPDNRRAVDFENLEARLNALESSATVRKTDEKLIATQGLLALRRRRPGLFGQGTYEPVQVRGPLEQHVFAFRRKHDGDQVFVAVRRRVTSLLGGHGEALSGFGATTAVGIKGGPWFDWPRQTPVVPNKSLLVGLAQAPMVVFTNFPRESL